MKLITYSKPYTAFLTEQSQPLLHHHEQIELTYVLTGNVIYTSPDYTQTLHAKQVILHFPYEPHAFSLEKGSRMLTILFDIDFVPDFIRRFCEYRMPNHTFTKKELDASTHQALEWLSFYTEDTNLDNPDTALLKQRGWLTAILGDLFFKHNVMKRHDKLEPEIIRNIIDYIEQNMDKNFTSKDLCRTIGISQHYLSHNLKGTVFVTYNHLLASVKSAHADKLLAEANLSLLEIAFACGYENVSSFTRNYKKVTGYTPTEFRTGHGM